MTSYQHLCKWPEERLGRCLEKLEARRLGFDVDRRWYIEVCDSEGLESRDADISAADVIEAIDSQISMLRDALDHVRGMDELRDVNRHAAAVKERQI